MSDFAPAPGPSSGAPPATSGSSDFAPPSDPSEQVRFLINQSPPAPPATSGSSYLALSPGPSSGIPGPSSGIPSPSSGINSTTSPGRVPESGGPLPGNSPSGGGGVGTAAIMGIAVGGVVALIILVAIFWVCVARRKSKTEPGQLSCFGCWEIGISSYNTMAEYFKSRGSINAVPPGALDAGEAGGEGGGISFQHPSDLSKAFTYKELMESTNGFASSNLLGEGGFGRVYKGSIAGNLVAVKQLKIGGGQGETQFRAEVDIISRVHHRHLVSLVGYCISDNNRLLVYKYVPNGTLEEALHGPGKPVVDWATRLKIALGTARGLSYLHEDCHPRIIHRDIKGSNILLDDQWEAQVADFGLAKLADDSQTHVTTRVMGTFGYVAPEYAMSGKLTEKSDVYSFGVVLLELVTGKKPVDDRLIQADGDSANLVEWARPRLARALETGNVDAVADPNLTNEYSREEMFRMVEVAAICVRQTSHLRPSMAEALRCLAMQEADLHHGVVPGYSKDVGLGEAVREQMWRILHSGSSSAERSSSDARVFSASSRTSSEV